MKIINSIYSFYSYTSQSSFTPFIPIPNIFLASTQEKNTTHYRHNITDLDIQRFLERLQQTPSGMTSSIKSLEIVLEEK